MTNIKNLGENEFGIMEGEVYFDAIGQNIIINFEKEVPINYVEKQVQYLRSLEQKVIERMCYYANLYCKEYMEDYPDVDYSKGLDQINNPLELLQNDYMVITSIRIDMYKDENIRVLNLSGGCDWNEENGIQWLIKEDEVIYTGPDNELNVWYSSSYKDSLFNYAERGG